jgi:hypothetical protein
VLAGATLAGVVLAGATLAGVPLTGFALAGVALAGCAAESAAEGGRGESSPRAVVVTIINRNAAPNARTMSTVYGFSGRSTTGPSGDPPSSRGASFEPRADERDGPEAHALAGVSSVTPRCGYHLISRNYQVISGNMEVEQGRAGA